MNNDVEQFYDAFSETFVRDYVRGNRRCERQHQFFDKALPPSASRVLVMGCGSGQGAHYIAAHVARRASVLAVDISEKNIRLAQALFPHPKIEYRQLDVLRDPLGGEWDAIVLPDVYEHIPRQMRDHLHARLDRLLRATGRVLITLPTPAGQEKTIAMGGSSQIVDEPVTLADLAKMADDVRGTVTYYATVSIWHTNDFAHAVVERGDEKCRPITPADKLVIKGFKRDNLLSLAERRIVRLFGLRRLARWWRRRRVRSLLTGNKRADEIA